MTLRTYVVDPRLCNGCGSCEMWCSLYQKGHGFSRALSLVTVIRDPEEGFNFPLLKCSGQCSARAGDSPPCVLMCPTGALAYCSAEEAVGTALRNLRGRKHSPVFRLVSPTHYPYPVFGWTEEETQHARVD